MSNINHLISSVLQARNSFIESTLGLTIEQVNFKPSPEAWSILEIAEHMVWAERAGTYKMWTAVETYQQNKSTWTTPPIHHGLSVATIIENTWQSKEKVPDIAKPKWGGSLAFWITSLKACQPVLEALGEALNGLDLEQIIYPHPISGPMNMIQRIEFLAFHLDRHRNQIEHVKKHPSFLVS